MSTNTVIASLTLDAPLLLFSGACTCNLMFKMKCIYFGDIGIRPWTSLLQSPGLSLTSLLLYLYSLTFLLRLHPLNPLSHLHVFLWKLWMSLRLKTILLLYWVFYFLYLAIYLFCCLCVSSHIFLVLCFPYLIISWNLNLLSLRVQNYFVSCVCYYIYWYSIFILVVCYVLVTVL